MSANHFQRVGIGFADRCLLSVIDVQRHDDEVPLTVVVVPGGDVETDVDQ